VIQRIALLLTSAALAICWAFFLSSLMKGQGLISMDADTGIMDFTLVAVMSGIIVALSPKSGWWMILGWLVGQLALFVYDGMPKGRSPQMFQPTNFFEAAIYAVVFVAALNWSLIPGVIVGALIRSAIYKRVNTRN
jgi:hypothetical protein